MQETILTWIDATIAVPPILNNSSVCFQSDLVLVTKLPYLQLFIVCFYNHNTGRWYDTEHVVVEGVTHWAKVHLPKSNDYLKLNLNPINLN